uniref:Carboxypeptidase N subunit 2 n=1 Tax=Mastacembelus armatus TaxID=205130 RepID=A0A7N8XNF6_9TELE
MGLTLFLVLLLCHKGNTESKTSCPYTCQCFSPVQVLCADEQITSLPSNLSKEVKDFIIMTTKLEYLFPHTLRESPQLTKLVFLNNALRSIHAQAFENLTELQELEISGNPQLDHLFLGTFSKQGNLTKLLLNFNRFKTVHPGMFDSLIQLETLQMKGNVISALPTFLFMNLQNLHVLDLSENKLEELIKLHLEWNRISELADGVFSVLTELKVLNLRGNLLTTFSDKVFGFESFNLKEMNLKDNKLTALSSLGRLTSLSDIILSSNQLSKLPENLFTNVTLLENVDLSENHLTSLPQRIFSNLCGIKMINLHKNNLSRLDARLFEDQDFIQQLYLSDNQLETLPLGFLDHFAIQHTVRLHGNPWKCDCHMWYLHDWVVRNSQDIEMPERMLCESPGFLRRRTVTSVDKDELVCQVSKSTMPDLSSCSLQASSDTIIINCKVEKCSPLTVKVQFQEDGGSVEEHIFKNEPEPFQCRNKTMIENPSEVFPDD